MELMDICRPMQQDVHECVNVSDFEALRLSAGVVRALAEGRVPHGDVIQAAESALRQSKTLRAAGVTEYSDETGGGVWTAR